DADRHARIEAIFSPFHRIIDSCLDDRRCKAAVAIHSFTPVMDGSPRPWDIGFLYRKDQATSKTLAAAVGTNDPDLVVGFNQPYQIDDISDWFVPQHGERRRLPHSLIEVRNDHLCDDLSIALWTDRLAGAIETLMETL
ncbi:MAG: N-formylglutamate amidohydrolase, partial [Geminicoccaceae bacterium]